MASTAEQSDSADIERRAQLVAQLASMPAAMRERQQWMLWCFELNPKKPQGKQLKVPYYADGGRRYGGQGDEKDRRRLASFDAVLQRLQESDRYTGIGFAFLPGDGLIGVDVDRAVDPETGELSDLCMQVVQRCPSYCELSPSGTGVHVIVEGTTETAKHDPLGLEVFCGSQFFTCTGRRWSGSPDDVRPIEPEALAWLHAEIQASKDRAKAGKLSSGSSVYAPPAAGHGQLAAWLDQALATLNGDCGYNEWIGIGMALKSALGDAGFRMWDYWSETKGRGKYPGSERLQVHWKSFDGTDPDGALTVFKMARAGKKWNPPRDWLAVYGTEVQRARIAREDSVNAAQAKRDETAATVSDAEGPAVGPDERPEPPSPPDHADGQSGGVRARDEGGGGIERLRKHFVLIYGTDLVWDGEKRITMKVQALRLIFGNDQVKLWLSDPARRRVVLMEHLVFEPGKTVPDDHINLFDGFPLQPVECTKEDVAPMLELLWHLCSQSAPTREGLRAVFRWVLCWLALPLQRPGSKLASALVFHGPQGTGKNLFFDCIRAIYGKYGRMVGQTELEDKFNDWLSAKLFIIGNEVVTRQELFHHKNKLKWIVTEDEVPIRGMHQSVRWESNHAQVVFLSNENQPLALEKDDRRHLVVYTPISRDDDLYARVKAFTRDGGAAKFMYFLQHYPLGDFHEHTKPLMTEAKLSLIELGLKPAERFATEWLDGLLPLPLHPCSAEQLYKVFRRWCEQTGERYPPVQATFTNHVRRFVHERVERDLTTGDRLEPALAYKVIQLKDLTDMAASARKAVRCWLPRGTGPGDGQTEGEWAASCVDSFEKHVHRFGRTAHVEAEA